MRSSFILISILLLTNCTSDNNSKASKDKVIIPNEAEATNQSSNNETDKTMYVLKQNDTLYYKKGDSILLKTFLSPLKKDVINETVVVNSLDEHAVITNLLFIFRDVSYSQESDVMPEINSVEIYNENGLIKTINKSDKKSQSLLGFDFNSNFNGNKFSNKTNDFGVILIEAEGSLYGYLHIKKNAEIKEVTLDSKLNIQGEMYTTVNGKNNEIIWNKLTNDYKPISLIINKDGDYRIKN